MKIRDMKDLDVPKYHCNYCGVKITEKGRRLWCSDNCVDEFLFRTRGSEVRKRVGRRDRGVCSCCGCNTKRIERLISRNARIGRLVAWAQKRIKNKLFRSGTPFPQAQRESYSLGRDFRDLVRDKLLEKTIEARTRFQAMGFQVGYLSIGNTKSLWEAHHVIPVHRGGGMPASLDAYVTLCTPCHQKHHARDRELKNSPK